MSFRDDVRRYFERVEPLNSVPAGLRESVTAETFRGVTTAPPRTIRWAVAVAGVLAVAIVAGLLASGSLRRFITTPVSPSTQSPVASPSQPLIPTGVLPPGTVLDTSLYNNDSGWVLLERCSGGMCTYFVSTSQSKGPWTGPVQVGPVYPAGDTGAPSHVHVISADGMSGVAYGYVGAWVTHDGGRTWQSMNLNRSVVSIAGLGTAWMVTEGFSCDYLAPCAEVQMSHDAGRTWSPTSRLPVFSPANVVAFGKGGLLMSAYGTGNLVLTEDGGGTWTQIKGNCNSDSIANRIAITGAQIWQACTGARPPAVESTMPWSSPLFVSNDAGRQWALDGLVPAGTHEALWSSTANRLVVATDTAGLMVTNDRGNTWTQVQTNPRYAGIVSVSYLADGSAWALDARGTIWATADAGQTWKKLASSVVGS